MLTITVGGEESYDETSESFVIVGGTELQLEHSLVSLSKWESIHEKPFLGKEDKTSEETISYIKCMLLTPDIPPEVFQQLDRTTFEKINEYLQAKMTATWFNDQGPPKPQREAVTAELIYYWMTVFSIPFTCETWNLNRLMTLIRICNLKQDKPKKMGRGEAVRRQRELNEQRKKQFGTTG